MHVYFTIFRLMTANYSDGKGLPRGGLNPSTLPSPRKISVAVHQANVHETQERNITLAVMGFGQFVDHGLSMTSAQDLHCCNKTFSDEDAKKDPKDQFCFNIDIKGDYFYQDRSKCFPFTRSDQIKCPDSGIREQFNAVR